MAFNKSNVVDKFGKPVGFDQTAAFTPKTPTFASTAAGRSGVLSSQTPSPSGVPGRIQGRTPRTLPTTGTREPGEILTPRIVQKPSVIGGITLPPGTIPIMNPDGQQARTLPTVAQQASTQQARTQGTAVRAEDQAVHEGRPGSPARKVTLPDGTVIEIPEIPDIPELPHEPPVLTTPTETNPFPEGINGGRFLSFVSQKGYKPSNEGLQALVTYLNQFPEFADARVIPHEPFQDKVDFGDGRIIDLIRGASDGEANGGWQWIDTTGSGAAPDDVTTTLSDFLTRGTFDPTPIAAAPQSYQAGTVPTNPLSTFVPSTFNFNDGGVTDETRSVIGELLGSPSFSDNVVNQLRERQKDTILALGESSRQQALQRGATRGVSQGGAVSSQLADIRDQEAANITGAFRDIDITAAQQNRADQLAAVDRADQFLNSSFGRQIGGAGFNADQAFRGFESEQQSEADLVNRFLTQQGLDQAASDRELARYSAEQQLAQGSRRLDLEKYLGSGKLELEKIFGEEGLNQDLLRILLGS